MKKPAEPPSQNRREDPFITGLRRIFDADDSLKMAAVSKRAGLDPSTIGKIVGGKTTTVQHSNAEKIAKALGRTVESISIGTDPVTQRHEMRGLAEGQAEPWLPPNHSPATDTLAFLKQGLRHPASYRITRPSPSLGILAGDVVIIDLANPPKDGDIILVGAIKPADDTGGPEVITLLRRYLGHFAISGDPGEGMAILDLDGHDASWRGTVCAMFRKEMQGA